MLLLVNLEALSSTPTWSMRGEIEKSGIDIDEFFAIIFRSVIFKSRQN
jgi:hypothetical protein